MWQRNRCHIESSESVAVHLHHERRTEKIDRRHRPPSLAPRTATAPQRQARISEHSRRSPVVVSVFLSGFAFSRSFVFGGFAGCRSQGYNR